MTPALLSRPQAFADALLEREVAEVMTPEGVLSDFDLAIAAGR